MCLGFVALLPCHFDGMVPLPSFSREEAEVQVKGYANAEHKKFETKREAVEYIAALQPLQNAPRKRGAAHKVEDSTCK